MPFSLSLFCPWWRVAASPVGGGLRDTLVVLQRTPYTWPLIPTLGPTVLWLCLPSFLLLICLKAALLSTHLLASSLVTSEPLPSFYPAHCSSLEASNSCEAKDGASDLMLGDRVVQ